jgi:antitoxin (DNA-binding transcriptional repressor) of toxin-antitoxin stability system
MDVISAAEANRCFSRLLREVADGKSFTVLSRGRAVATISAPQQAAATYGPARERLLQRLSHQVPGGGTRAWRRDELYD